jgi:hypothetical protein
MNFGVTATVQEPLFQPACLVACACLRFSPASRICASISTEIPADGLNEPNQAPVIHSLFIVLVIRICLSTLILGIIAARAVPP